MTQIIVINDTGHQIPMGEIELDDINQAPPVEAILYGSLVSMYNLDASAHASATATVMAAIVTATYEGHCVALKTGSDDVIEIGVNMETYQVLILNVRLKGEIVRT